MLYLPNCNDGSRNKGVILAGSQSALFCAGRCGFSQCFGAVGRWLELEQYIDGISVRDRLVRFGRTGSPAGEGQRDDDQCPLPSSAHGSAGTSGTKGPG